MARFSDIFVYESAQMVQEKYWMYRECHLLKNVGTNKAGDYVALIRLDTLGMVLFIDKAGPFVLTTVQ